MLTMLVMLAAQAGAGQLRADIQRDTPPGQATMKVYDGDKLLFQVASQGLSCIKKSKFSSDGRWLLNIASGCGYVQLWDIIEGKRIHSFLSNQYKTVSADFTPDSRHLLLNFDKRDTIKYTPTFWSIVPLKKIGELYNYKRESYYGNYNSNSGVGFDKKGERMVFVGSTGPASIWNAKTGAYISTIPRLPYPNKDRGGAGSQDARLSPDGKHVLVLYADGRLAEYEVKTAKLLRVRGKPTDYQKQLQHFAQTGH